jgi:hypothetical protein
LFVSARGADGSRYGFAFDDGALNRVVEAGRDSEELQKLELFLSAETSSIKAANTDDEWSYQPGPSTPHTRTWAGGEKQYLSCAEALEHTPPPKNHSPSKDTK